MWLIQIAPVGPVPGTAFWDIAEKLSGAVIAMLFFFFLWKRVFVMGAEFEAMVSERDWWRRKWELDHARKENPPGD